MSKFLNNFQDSNYQASTEDQAEEVVEAAASEEKLQIKARSRQNISETSGAFAEEEVEIDQNYQEFQFKKIVAICATIIASLVLLIVLYLLMNQTVAITLVDKTESEATTWLDKEHVNYDIVRAESNEFASGKVISQSIPAGERIGFGDQQQITVSTGPNLTEIVELTGLEGKTKTEIEAFVKDNAIINVKYTSEYSSKVPADKLIRLSFEDDSITPKNYTRKNKVEFIISKGDKSDKKNTKVNNFINQKADSVRSWAEGTGILLDEKQVASDIPAGYVISQSIEPETMIGFGDVFTYEVSKGPGTPMPNLIGYTVEDATAIASDSKISFTSKQSYSSGDAGVIVDQSVAAGTGVFEDDVITVTESLGRPFISSMTGASLGDFVSSINEFNKQGAGLTYSTKEAKMSQKDIENGVQKGTIKSISNQNNFVDVGTHIVVTVYA
ncbi:PASTA domain-containing protein [Mollicutes bacterium LVI A0039]|nr:PASTA domain-containing protein [Mollicutes bacterium LVI A0039]